jgi:hypothetical protein
MVGHEDINRTEQAFARGGMEEQFAEMEMKNFVQPAGGVAFQRDRPLHHGESAIKIRREARQMMPIRLRHERRRFHAASVAAFGRKPQTKKRGALPRRRYGTIFTMLSPATVRMSKFRHQI